MLFINPKVIRKLREHKGWNVTQLAEGVMHERRLKDIENTRFFSQVTPNTAKLLADKLEVSVEMLCAKNLSAVDAMHDQSRFILLHLQDLRAVAELHSRCGDRAPLHPTTAALLEATGDLVGLEEGLEEACSDSLYLID